MEFGSVIFDMDGVILNSLVNDEKWKFDAVRDALESLGVDPSDMSREELRDVLGDKGYSAVVKKSAELGLEPGEVWRVVAHATTDARLDQMENGNFRLYPGVKETLEELRSEDIRLGVISNAPESGVEAAMEYFDLKQFFHFYRGVQSFEDLQRKKPNPNHLEIARAELKENPMAYAGDAAHDVEAAKRADMTAIRINGHGDEADSDFSFDSINGLRDL